MEIINRKARHEYIIIEDFIAGIVLKGSEVKSIKSGKCNISDSYCYISNNEIWMKNCHISKYNSDIFNNHEELSDRKLLLTKKEIQKLNEKSTIPGFTIIPLKIFINKTGLIKVSIGLCKGKKEYDKRESIKERENKIELDRLMKNF